MDVLKADLPTLIDAIKSVASDTESTFGHLTAAQLNWKPSAERWSVAQCFDHLLTTNKGYFPIIDLVLKGQYPRSSWGVVPGLPGFWGKLLIKFLDPASTRKLKAPKPFAPSQSDLSASIISEFVNQQTTITEKMKATQGLDLEKTIISSPAAKPVTYSLMDAYRIIVVHERRHFQQAQRVMEESSFPG